MSRELKYLAQQLEPGVAVVGGEHLEHQGDDLYVGALQTLKVKKELKVIQAEVFSVLTSSTYSSGDSFLPILSTAPRTEAAEAPPSNSCENQNYVDNRASPNK